MTAGSRKSISWDPSDEIDDETDVALIRERLHAQIEEIFRPGLSGSEIYQGCLVLSGRLIAIATPLFDLAVGLGSQASTTTPHDLAAAGNRARDDVKALVLGVPGPTTDSTADIGLMGASVVVGQLAAVSGDSYLNELATALAQLACGQVHPWLRPPKASVHPREHAKTVLEFKAVPFCVIEYLVASGLQSTKTAAKAAVVERLGISEDTLNDWRKQQRKYHSIEFGVQIKRAAKCGRQVKFDRERVTECPQLQLLIDANNNLLGLPAVDRAAKALKDLGADKGQR